MGHLDEDDKPTFCPEENDRPPWAGEFVDENTLAELVSKKQEV